MRTPNSEQFFENHPMVAVKKIPNPNKKDKDEVEILKRLDHNHIVKYFKSYVDISKNLCIVMQFCGNGTLSEIIRKKPNLGSERNVLTICNQLSSALDYIHNQHILHRDIKPDNILCQRFEVVDLKEKFTFKLADFGIAKVMNKSKDGNSYAETHCGTPIYMSPEVLNGQKYSTPTDIWSLGVVISFICNQGKHLFTSIDDVKKWDGSKNPIDEKKYSKYLCKLITDIMKPIEKNRPMANDISQETKTLSKILNR